MSTHDTPGPESDQEWVQWLESVLDPLEHDDHDALNDHDRLRAVESLQADQVTHVQPLVTELLAGAAEMTGAPVSLANVLLSGTVVISGEHGLTGWMAESRAVPAEWAPCATVVRTGLPHVIRDMAVDDLMRENPLHLVDGVRSYAGVPMRTEQGHVIGTVCVLDTVARDFTDTDLAGLQRIAEETVRRLTTAAHDEPEDEPR